MQDEGKKIRFRNRGNKCIAEFLGDYFVAQEHQGAFVKPVAMFRILNEQEDEVLGCVTFTEHLLIDSIWSQPHKKHFPSSYRPEALANLLHYLPLDFDKLKKVYPNCYEYRFDREFAEGQGSDNVFIIKANDSFEATFQRIIFGDTTTNSAIQNAALEVMYNDWEDHPDTNVLVDLLVSILPVREIDLIKNLKLLLDEDKIRAVTEPSNPQKLVSVGLKPKAIRELEGETEPVVKSPQVIKNIYGPNFEASTHGANSHITINVDKIETFFENIRKEIEEKDLKPETKEELSRTVTELETEITKTKNPKKVAEIIRKLQSSAGWIWHKILLNPYISGVILELATKALLG